MGFHVPSNFFKQKPSWAFTKLMSELSLNQYFGNLSLQDKAWLWAWHPGLHGLSQSPQTSFKHTECSLQFCICLCFFFPQPSLPHVQPLFSDISRAHFPTLPVHVVYLSSLCVLLPVLCLCCLVLICLLSLWPCFSQAYAVGSLCIYERFQWTQDGWGQTERILRALHLHPGEVTQAGPLSYPCPLVSLVSSSSWTPHCPQVTLSQLPKHDLTSQMNNIQRYV